MTILLEAIAEDATRRRKLGTGDGGEAKSGPELGPGGYFKYGTIGHFPTCCFSLCFFEGLGTAVLGFTLCFSFWRLAQASSGSTCWSGRNGTSVKSGDNDICFIGCGTPGYIGKTGESTTMKGKHMKGVLSA